MLEFTGVRGRQDRPIVLIGAWRMLSGDGADWQVFAAPFHRRHSPNRADFNMLSAEQELVHDLQRSQWLSVAEIAESQRPLIERLVRHAATQTQFYRERLAPLFGGSDPASAPVGLNRWSEVPVVRRADVVDHLETMTARSVPPDAGSVHQGESSGSTGRPFRHMRSARAVTMANALLERIYELFEVDLNGSLAHITLDKQQTCMYPGGGSFKGWNFQSPNADLLVLDIRATAEQQLEWLERVRPTHVMTYPETLREVAEAAEAQDSSLRFETFIATGEMLKPETRDLIARKFGCQTIDVYGAREMGPIAFQCPDESGYHVCAEGLLVELLDEADRPVSAGAYGRIVVTSLYNYAMPFIRYDIGDYALVAAGPCACGRGLPKLDQIAGRTRNLFVMPDGSKRRLQGALVLETAKYLSYRQVQFVQTTIDTIQINYVPGHGDTVADHAMLTQLFRRAFHDAVNVRLMPVDRIERGAGMKLEQFVSLVTG
jgi:phenylacetate-CoA ligase